MKIILELRSGPYAGTKLSLAFGKPLRIGRRPDADHSFSDDKQMSGLHFAIEHSEKGCRLLDLNSSNGTFLNGARTKEAFLANGDQIRAGTTTFVVRMLRDEPISATPAQLPTPAPPASQSRTPTELPPVSSGPALPAPAPLKLGELPSFPMSAPRVSFPEPVSEIPKPEAPAPALPRLRDILTAKDLHPLFALLDASREPSVLKVIYESKEEFQSLFEGPQGAQLAHFAPYLLRVPPKAPLIDTLAKQAWSKSWGVFLTSDLALKELRTHLRHFLNVKLPDGKQVYFRYYDPRVLRLFLPTCLPDETTQFFGPVKQFLMEAEDPATALHFTRGPKGAAQKELHLASV